jgi:two-component system, sensor histidine kinase PdtaS
MRTSSENLLRGSAFPLAAVAAVVGTAFFSGMLLGAATPAVSFVLMIPCLIATVVVFIRLKRAADQPTGNEQGGPRTATMTDHPVDLLRAVIDLNPNLIYAKADDGTIVLANAAIARLRGRPAESLIGKTERQIGSPAQEEELFSRSDEYVRRTGEDVNIPEERVMAVDGNERWLQTVKRLIPANTAHPRLVLGISTDITARRNTEEELRESKLLLNSILESIPDLVSRYDHVNDRFDYMNRNMKEFLGVSEVALKTLDREFIQVMMHADDLGAYERQHELYAAHPDIQPTPIEYRMRNASDEWRWLRSREIVYSRTPDGRVRQVINIIEDVTGRRSAEEALRNNECFVRGILNSLSSPIAVLDPHGRILEVNGAWEAFAVESGARPSMEAGRGADYLGVCDRAAAEGDALASGAAAGIRKVLAGHDSDFVLEYPCDTPAGRRWFLLHATPLVNGSIRAVIAHEDITRQKSAETETRRARDFYLTLFEDFPDPIRRSGPDGNCNYVNRTWITFTGRNLQQEIGQEWMRGVHEADRERYESVYREAFRTGESYQIEYRLRHRDGKGRWVMENGRPFFTVDGVFGGYIATVHDHSALKNSEEAIRQSLTERESLLQEVHHRVKNNMQIISSLLSLQLNNVENTIVRQALNESRNRIRSMALVHEQLYQSSSFSGIGLLPYISKLADNLARSYLAPDRPIRMDIAVENIQLDLDTTIPLGLIINELLTNAMKYAYPEDRGGTISIAVRRTGEKMLTLEVADDGMGLPSGFDPGKSATLGLSLVRTLAQQLDGNVVFEGDRGTKVVVEFREQHYGDS